MSGPRVGIVGARRARQGLGPFVARDLAAAGARVAAFTATTEATRSEAARALHEIAGVEARGYASTGAMLDAEPLDAIAILSPAEHHEEALEAALSAGVHALCEKPLVWGIPDLARRARAITDRFDAQGLLLWENCQWPRTLRGFAKLHPGALDAPPGRFEMELQPVSKGLQALGDSLPHPISLLQALAPGPARVTHVHFATSSGAEGLTVGFHYEFGAGRTAVEVRLLRSDTHPRRAALIVDGRRADRLVSAERYRLSFAANDRRVPIDDPLGLLVSDFVSAVRGAGTRAGTSRTSEIAERMQHLADLVGAHSPERTV